MEKKKGQNHHLTNAVMEIPGPELSFGVFLFVFYLSIAMISK